MAISITITQKNSAITNYHVTGNVFYGLDGKFYIPILSYVNHQSYLAQADYPVEKSTCDITSFLLTLSPNPQNGQTFADYLRSSIETYLITNEDVFKNGHLVD